ncbi:MAG: glutamate synthase subunit beta [Sandaracinaceae bacterium]
MGKPTGFQEFERVAVPHVEARRRLRTFDEFTVPADEEHLRQQGARCMDCGVPFCMSDTGCPVDNLIPEWNDLVYRGMWREAVDRLHKTNNFPEVTGRVCPAPCEGACVLGIHEPPVTIKDLEQAIVDRGFEEGWIVPKPPERETGKSVAVVGSGPAGLAAAQQLRRVGHRVTVYERDDRVGGLMMYGIPNMKLDKRILGRRLHQLEAEGVRFLTGIDVGTDVSVTDLWEDNDAVLLATGATVPRDLPIEGRDLEGIHFAMDFLRPTTKALIDHGYALDGAEGAFLSARDRRVLVIGGGDTGTDCIGTSLRHGCASLTNFELMDRKPDERAADNPWPEFPQVFKVDYGHEEAAARFGADPRQFGVRTTRFVDDGSGRVGAVETVRVRWDRGPDGRWRMEDVRGSEERWDTDLVLLAMGFVGPEETVLAPLSLARDRRGNVDAAYGRYQTSAEGVFAAGDCRRGQSLVVWAIAEGRGAARAIDEFLMGESDLAAPD